MKTKSILLAAVLLLFAVAPGHAQDQVKMTVKPQLIEIGAFFDGTTLTATGLVPSDSQVIVRFLGATCDLHVKQKGKIFGLMWMNLDSLIFRGIPSVCIVNAAQDFDNLTQTTGAHASTVQGLRLAGLKDKARIESNGSDQEKAFAELIKLKNIEGLYRETSGNISYGQAENGQRSFQADVAIPSRLLPGDYVVELVAVNGKGVIARAEQPITVQLVGFPALLARLAFDHAALYGILATVIALVAGLAIGMVFDSKGAH
jgi:hypothetical protein